MTTLRVALVDDHLLFREGLRAMLASSPDLKIVAEASKAEEALPAVRASQPEVVVLDVLLPGVSGIGIARELLRDDPNRRVLALSMVATRRTSPTRSRRACSATPASRSRR